MSITVLGAHNGIVRDVEHQQWSQPAIRVAGVVGLLGFCWVAGGFVPFTVPAEVSTFVAGAAVLGLGWRTRPRGERVRPVIARRSWWVWLGWLGAVTGWELWSLFAAPRALHPTISSLLSPLLDTESTRAVGVLAWLVFGWWLTRR